MKKIAGVIVCLCFVSTVALGTESASDFNKYWPQWRGPLATGVAPYGDPPVAWGEDKNVRWKIEIPGKGHSSPIVWGDKIFVTTAIETDTQVNLEQGENNERQLPEWRRSMSVKATRIHRFEVLAIDRQDGIVYVTSGFRGNALLAISLDLAKGDITNSEAIVWQHDKDTPYAPSPMLYSDTLYFLEHNRGILSCFNAKTGEKYYGPKRLKGIKTVFASPVGASGRVYITSKDGLTLVIKHSPNFEVLANNLLDDSFTASPAIAGEEMYLRGHKYLYCIARD